jgi:hypothetical protein
VLSNKLFLILHVVSGRVSREAWLVCTSPTIQGAVVQKHTASPCAPCVNPLCNNLEVEPKDFLRCGQCKTVAYCSRECQKDKLEEPQAVLYKELKVLTGRLCFYFIYAVSGRVSRRLVPLCSRTSGVRFVGQASSSHRA